jgi:hypothetical protein
VAAIPELCWKKILDQCATSQTTYISFKTNTIANSILLAREDAGLMTIFYILRVQFRYLAETCECTNQVAAIPELCWKKS